MTGPRDVRQMGITMDGLEAVEVAYRRTGRSHPVLLIAGTGYPGQTWFGPFLTGLEERMTVYTYDHRGTGLTPGTDGDYSTRLLAADAARLIADVIGEPVLVIGHSMGGRVAQWLAIDRPELVRRLVLVATGTGNGAKRDGSGIPRSAVEGLMSLGYEGYVRELQRSTFFTPEFRESRPDVVGMLGERFWSHRPSLTDYLKHVQARQLHDSTAVVATITSPTMIMVGERDTHVGGTGSHFEQSVQLHQAIAGSELTVIEDAVHGVFWEQPEAVLAAITAWSAA